MLRMRVRICYTLPEMQNNGKGKNIGEVLRAEIVSGKYDVTRKLPSDRMLMRRFSVARATVQAAMRELLEKKLVERRPGYGTFLADLAETKAAQKFAMIVPDAYYPFYARICRGIEDAAKKRGWTILTAALGSGSMRERALRAVEFSEVCIREKVSGVFFADPANTRAAARVFAGKSRPDAIIAVNDYIASILLKTLKTIGKRVPEDVLLAGVNGDPLAEEAIPPITTVVQPCHEIGATAVSLMFERLANPDLLPREVFLSARLLERESTRGKNGRAGAPRTPQHKKKL